MRFRSGLRELYAVIVAALLASGSATSFAWSDHASLLWPLVRQMPVLLEPAVEVEELEVFLQAEADGLETFLAAEEARARTALDSYAPRPEALAFSATAKDLRRAFLEAIRVNPTLSYTLYRQEMVEDEPIPGPLSWDSLSILSTGISHETVTYRPLAVGDLVAPAYVIASASDEPDFGMDIGLFEDNGTEFGARYGFGVQPFGNPNLEYGSQAPFHMGFYHLDLLTRTLQPDLLRTYPAWRVSLFGALSEFAFATGHDYWGWRFAGWALHYIGDLTQPYHAQPLPGVDTLEALWTVVRGRTDEAVQLVSNRHGVIESYQHQRLLGELKHKAWRAPLLLAVGASSPVPVWGEETLIEGLSRESVDGGTALDAALEAHIPERFVSDVTFEWTGSDEELTLLSAIRQEKGDGAIMAMDAILIEQMARFSRYARAWVNKTLAQHKQTGSH